MAFIEGCPNIRGTCPQHIATYIVVTVYTVRIVTQIQNLDSGPGAHVNGANSYYRPPASGGVAVQLGSRI